MSNLLGLFVRLCAVVLGYGVAALCASGFLHFITVPMLGLTPEEMHQVAFGSAVFSVPFVAMFVGYFAFLPAIPAILLGEILGQRDWLFYALAGGVIGAFVGVSGPMADSVHPDGAATSFILALIGAGICGGIGYWIVAGRGAGAWRRPSRDVISPEP